VAFSFHGEPGGIRGLRELLNGEHGGALRYDLLQLGYIRQDIGYRIGWDTLRDFITWLGPTSATYRSNNPKTWWVTTELQFLANIDYNGRVANWQRGDPKKRGNPPQPMKFPKETSRSGLTSEQQRERKKKFLEQRKAVS
jgi:hypothetical protein